MKKGKSSNMCESLFVATQLTIDVVLLPQLRRLENVCKKSMVALTSKLTTPLGRLWIIDLHVRSENWRRAHT